MKYVVLMLFIFIMSCFSQQAKADVRLEVFKNDSGPNSTYISIPNPPSAESDQQSMLSVVVAGLSGALVTWLKNFTWFRKVKRDFDALPESLKDGLSEVDLGDTLGKLIKRLRK